MLVHSVTPPVSLKRKLSVDDSPSYSQNYVARTFEQAEDGSPRRVAAGLKRFRTGTLEPEAILRLQTHATLTNPPVRKLLSMLPSEQLSGIICSLVESNSHLQDALVSLIPRPTLMTASQLLGRAEKSVLEAFPYNRNGPTANAYSFNRVRPLIDELRDLVIYFCDFFVLPSAYPLDLQHEYPALAFGYLDLATTLVHRLPVWEDPSHDDQTRGLLYRRLGYAWRVAVSLVGTRVREGKIFGAAPVREWAEKLHMHCEATNGNHGMREAVKDFETALGWVAGGAGLTRSPFAAVGTVSSVLSS
ncbi:Tethering factor for nuclear proteasome sts1 [Thoreauomyces humboldtii]|nr:Tethering factor for nuclear proteasome sts1 [Thoreauomyces humboldtii]